MKSLSMQQKIISFALGDFYEESLFSLIWYEKSLTLFYCYENNYGACHESIMYTFLQVSNHNHCFRLERVGRIFAITDLRLSDILWG